MESMQQRGVPIRAASRTLFILQVVNQSTGLTMKQIADRTGLPYPTVRRIVYTLVHDHFLQRDEPTKRYSPTELVTSLSHGFQDHSVLISAARPFVEEFTTQHLWPVSLVTRVGQMMVVRDSTHSVSSMTFTNYQAGAVFPMLECASGQLWLAHASEAERTTLIRGAEQSEIRVDPHVLSQLKSETFSSSIRSAGYAVAVNNRFTDTPGRTSSVAVPVLKDGQLIAALVLIYFSAAMKAEIAVTKYLEQLEAQAKNIAAAIPSATVP